MIVKPLDKLLLPLYYKTLIESPLQVLGLKSGNRASCGHSLNWPSKKAKDG